MLGASSHRMLGGVLANCSLALLDHIQLNKERLLFIDFGSNIGQGFEYFSSCYSPDIFDYWLYEPNLNCMDTLKSRVSDLYTQNSWHGACVINNSAVAPRDGYAKLLGLPERGPLNDGATLISDHLSEFFSLGMNADKAPLTKCITGSKILRQAADKYRTIVVKMDIELAEYDVLEEMIASEAHCLVHHWYIEWHENQVAECLRSNYLSRKSKILEALGTSAHSWL